MGEEGGGGGLQARVEQAYARIRPTLRFFGSYYVSNMLVMLSYPLARQAVYSYRGSFAAYALPHWERQALGTFAVVAIVKFFRSSTLDAFFAEFFMYGKAALGVLVYMVDRWAFGVYMLVYAAIFVLFPQPKYDGPDSLHYLTPALFDEKVIRCRTTATSNRDDASTSMWLVEFYASWSPPCVQIEPLVADISLRYATHLLSFGKLDVGRWPHVAKQHGIAVGGSSRQLPTFIMFRDGKEIGRVPHVYADGSIAKGRYRKQDLIKAFELDALYIRASSAKRARRRQENTSRQMDPSQNAHTTTTDSVKDKDL